MERGTPTFMPRSEMENVALGGMIGNRSLSGVGWETPGVP